MMKKTIYKICNKFGSFIFIFFVYFNLLVGYQSSEPAVFDSAGLQCSVILFFTLKLFLFIATENYQRGHGFYAVAIIIKLCATHRFSIVELFGKITEFLIWHCVYHFFCFTIKSKFLIRYRRIKVNHRKKDQEKNERSENIHSHRV